MRKRIRLTESDLYRIVAESVKRIIREDGEGAIGGGGATNTCGLGAGGSYPYYDAPVNAGRPMRRGFYDPAMSRKKLTTKHADEEGSDEVNKRNPKKNK